MNKKNIKKYIKKTIFTIYVNKIYKTISFVKKSVKTADTNNMCEGIFYINTILKVL